MTFDEREEISRGLAGGESLRVIAARLGRASSTVSREVAGNGGRAGTIPFPEDGDDDGCGCSTVGSQETTPRAAWLPAFAAIAAFVRRRRRAAK